MQKYVINVVLGDFIYETEGVNVSRSATSRPILKVTDPLGGFRPQRISNYFKSLKVGLPDF